MGSDKIQMEKTVTPNENLEKRRGTKLERMYDSSMWHNLISHASDAERKEKREKRKVVAGHPLPLPATP